MLFLVFVAADSAAEHLHIILFCRMRDFTALRALVAFIPRFFHSHTMEKEYLNFIRQIAVLVLLAVQLGFPLQWAALTAYS